MLRVFEKLQLNVTQPSIFNMLKFMNTEDNNTKGLTFDQFIELATEYFNERHTQEGIERIFQLYDFGNKGYLNHLDLQRISNETDLYMTSEQIGLILQRASIEGGQITLADFEYIMKNEEYE